MKSSIGNIVLIGMMGSGKSVIAKELSKQLKRPVYSTDAMIVKKLKKSIPQIVALKGWDYFRQVEHRMVQSVSRKNGVIIDCGGGVVSNPDNLKILQKNGKIIFLKASPAVIYQRIKNDPNRPLIHDVPNPLGALKKIYQQRLPLYNQADMTVNTSKASIASPVARIISACHSRSINRESTK